MPDIETNTVHTGECREVLSSMPEGSVHMMMFSPPYYGLRDYGESTDAIYGADPDCDHDWVSGERAARGGTNTDDNPPDVGGDRHAQESRLRGDGAQYHICEGCGAHHGQLGLEPSVDMYVRHMAELVDAAGRVLRDDGSLYLNLGDTYAGSWGGQSHDADENQEASPAPGKNPARSSRIRRKSKMLVPYRVAIALQDEGWVVRNDITWVKPNPMPNPVKDRLNTTTERVFHLTLEPDYWYDLDPIREPDPSGKNPGDVFEIATKPFPDAHFAVYPPELCDKPIKATCPPKVCVECGTPYEKSTSIRKPWELEPRHVQRDQLKRAIELARQHDLSGSHYRAIRAVGIQDAGQALEVYDGAGRNAERTEELAEEAKDALGGYFREFVGQVEIPDGWIQPCDCDTDETEPGIALDPFAGAGTTLLKAKELRRRFVGIELNPEYADMARARVGLAPKDPSHVRGDDAQQGIEAFRGDAG